MTSCRALESKKKIKEEEEEESIPKAHNRADFFANVYQLLLCCVVGYISNYECHKFAPKSKPPCIINTSLRQQNTQPLENCSLAYSRNQRALILLGGEGEANPSKLHLLVKPEQASSLGGKKHKKKTKKRKEKSTSMPINKKQDNSS